MTMYENSTHDVTDTTKNKTNLKYYNFASLSKNWACIYTYVCIVFVCLYSGRNGLCTSPLSCAPVNDTQITDPLEATCQLKQRVLKSSPRKEVAI